MADGPTNPGSIPVGGIYASVEIDTGSLRPDMQALHDILKKVSDQVDQLSGAMKGATTATQADADATNVYAVQAATGVSVAQRFAQAHFGVAQAAQQSVPALQAATQTTVQHAAATNIATNSTRKFQYGLIQIAYVMDDVQYGARALTNNVAALASSFGGPYAGYIALAATGTFLLYNHWDKLQGVLTAGIPLTKSEAERMDELGKATKRTAQETLELNELKEKQARIDATAGAIAEEIRDQKQGVLQAFSKSHGGKKIKGQLAGVLGSMGRGGDDQAEANLRAAEQEYKEYKEGWKKQFGNAPMDATEKGIFEKRIADLKKVAEQKRNANLNKMADDILADAQEDPEKLKELIGYAKKHPKAFAPGFAERLQRATPEGIAKEHQDKLDEEDRKSREAIADEKNQEVEKERTDQIKKHAESLKSMYQELRGKGLDPNQANIAGSLAGAGVKDAKFVAAEVLQLLKKQYEQDVRAKSLELGGVSTEEGAAALARENQIKAENKEIREAETPVQKAQRIAEERDAKRESIQQAKIDRALATRGRQTFGKAIGSAMRAQAQQGANEGDTDQQLYEQVRDQLMAKGMSQHDADVEAWGAVNAARSERDKKLNQQQFRQNNPMRQPGAVNAGARMNQAQADTADEDRFAKKIAKELADALEKAQGPPLKAIANNTAEMRNGVPSVLT